MNRWNMFKSGFYESQSLDLKKWENWTPILYYQAVFYGSCFLFIGCNLGLFFGFAVRQLLYLIYK